MTENSKEKKQYFQRCVCVVWNFLTTIIIYLSKRKKNGTNNASEQQECLRQGYIEQGSGSSHDPSIVAETLYIDRRDILPEPGGISETSLQHSTRKMHHRSHFPQDLLVFQRIGRSNHKRPHQRQPRNEGLDGARIQQGLQRSQERFCGEYGGQLHHNRQATRDFGSFLHAILQDKGRRKLRSVSYGFGTRVQQHLYLQGLSKHTLVRRKLRRTSIE
jgi:hypothetical protein